MATFLVTGGFNQDGQPLTQTIRADTFITDEQFVVFKTGSVVTHAIRAWQVDKVELLNPPVPADEE